MTFRYEPCIFFPGTNNVVRGHTDSLEKHKFTIIFSMAGERIVIAQNACGQNQTDLNWDKIGLENEGCGHFAQNDELVFTNILVSMMKL